MQRKEHPRLQDTNAQFACTLPRQLANMAAPMLIQYGGLLPSAASTLISAPVRTIDFLHESGSLSPRSTRDIHSLFPIPFLDF